MNLDKLYNELVEQDWNVNTNITLELRVKGTVASIRTFSSYLYVTVDDKRGARSWTSKDFPFETTAGEITDWVKAVAGRIPEYRELEQRVDRMTYQVGTLTHIKTEAEEYGYNEYTQKIQEALDILGDSLKEGQKELNSFGK